jgi:hypothetical protein
MDDIDVLNIPAFQRKRSLSAKARNLNKRLTDLGNPIIPKQAAPAQKTTRQRISSTKKIRKEQAQFREMITCGVVEGYFDKIKVAIIKVTSPIRVDDSLIFEQQSGLFEQTITSMQLDRKDISLARSGTDIGVQVIIEPTVGTNVYKVI